MKPHSGREKGEIIRKITTDNPNLDALEPSEVPEHDGVGVEHET